MKLYPIELFTAFLWNRLYIPLMLICAVLLTLRCRALQFRALPSLLGKTIFSRSSENNEKMRSFRACATALSSSVGTGNIVGTAQAITLGGPGALFWMWVSAFGGMIIKYAEVCLAVSPDSERISGQPMAYIERALGCKAAARFFAVFTVLSSLGIGNAVQVRCISDAAAPLLPFPCEIAPALTAFILAGASLLIFCGGTLGTGRLSAVLFPCMSLVFIVSAVCVIGANLERLPQVFSLIVTDAFSPRCLLGSGLSWGIRRAAFSNEAGFGSAALAHGTAYSRSPAEHGLWGIFEVFADTIVICSLTGITILCCPLPLPYGSLVGAEVYTKAVASVLGGRTAEIITAAVLILFAFSSLAGWSMYGGICAEYLFGAFGRRAYELLFISIIFLSLIMSTEFIWLASDLFNALMALPNLLSLILLSGSVGNTSRKLKLDESYEKSI